MATGANREKVYFLTCVINRDVHFVCFSGGELGLELFFLLKVFVYIRITNVQIFSMSLKKRDGKHLDRVRSHRYGSPSLLS